MSGRPFILLVTSSLAVVVLGLYCAFLGAHVDRLQAQVGRLQVQQSRQLVQVRGILPKLTGASRDLITCADLQDMSLSYLDGVNLANDSAGNIYATPVQSQVALPAHCINR